MVGSWDVLCSHEGTSRSVSISASRDQPNVQCINKATPQWIKVYPLAEVRFSTSLDRQG